MRSGQTSHVEAECAPDADAAGERRGPSGAGPGAAPAGRAVVPSSGEAYVGNGGRHPFIEGIATRELFALLLRNRFRVSPGRIWDLVRIINSSLYITAMSAVERARFGRKIDRAPLAHDPVFILGHWRSGTTYLHKLLSLDKRHTYPTVLQCSLPTCFMSCPRVIKYYVNARVPDHRPMDNVALGLDEPFEDEFALMKTTLMSPYLNLVFPRSGVDHEKYCDLTTVDPVERRRWMRDLQRFVRKIGMATGKRVILKSPTHSFRLPLLLEAFPNAKFILIARDPYTVYASTSRLWPKLLAQSSLQDATIPNLDELVFSRYMRVFEALERGVTQIPAGNYLFMKYEDLVGREIEQVRRIYEAFGFCSFAPFEPALEEFVEGNSTYVRNSYTLNEDQKRRIYARWRPAFEAYGYEA